MRKFDGGFVHIRVLEPEDSPGTYPATGKCDGDEDYPEEGGADSHEVPDVGDGVEPLVHEQLCSCPAEEDSENAEDEPEDVRGADPLLDANRPDGDKGEKTLDGGGHHFLL